MWNIAASSKILQDWSHDKVLNSSSSIISNTSKESQK